MRRRVAKEARFPGGRSASLLLAAAAVLMLPAQAAAHPLGNFTVNRFAELTFTPARARIHYVVDMAEIPTFQTLQRISPEGRRPTPSGLAGYAAAEAGRLVRRLELRAGGDLLDFTLRSSTARLSRGQGGLPVMRLELVATGGLPTARTPVTYSDRNYAGRPGWKEVVARASRGQGLTRSSVPSTSISEGLRRYPKNLLFEPMAVTSASIVLAPGEGQRSGPEPKAITGGQADLAEGWITSLVEQELSLGLALVAAAIAFGAGALHALGPGHGKTIMAAYLVGADGRPRHAVLVGIAVSMMHTASVVALGLATLWATSLFRPERVFPWLSVASGVVVLGLGAWLLYSRTAALTAVRKQTELMPLEEPARAHSHVHAGDTSHRGHSHCNPELHARAEHFHGGHSHSHAPPSGMSPFSLRGLAAVALSGGLLPSPSALVVLLGAVALHRVAFGLTLVAVFSVGLAATLTAVGLTVIKARDFAARRLGSLSARWLPLASAGLIVIVGAFITLRGVAVL